MVTTAGLLESIGEIAGGLSELKGCDSEDFDGVVENLTPNEVGGGLPKGELSSGCCISCCCWLRSGLEWRELGMLDSWLLLRSSSSTTR